ncbi:hypothetical protein SAMN05216188_103158 [Lentzea xinjiangensis]|uniref:Uncharacterized protein n=1 Tax=Lentzea xinjiangensis TaxID=402600 RepID=A0A1H9GC92_9PSEU|nr:hypothetical protein [Lentzea xinjiangensis]SEQ47663.1 hypothetical protein SAMN05216188_103158 [Lentzea xinjiangensis]
MRWSKGWIAAAGTFSVVAAIGGTAFALAGSGAPPSQPGVAGKEVCAGQPPRAVRSGGPAAVTSDQFPLGTSLRVTNLGNGRSITVPVIGTAAGCAVLNTAAFDSLAFDSSRPAGLGRGGADSSPRQVRVEIVGNAPAPVRSSTPRLRASGVVGQVVCDGTTVGVSAVGGAPGAFSSQLPVGTSVRVTNLDNGRQTTVRIVGVGPACVRLNSAAFESVAEPGKNVIDRVQLEKVT